MTGKAAEALERKMHNATHSDYQDYLADKAFNINMGKVAEHDQFEDDVPNENVTWEEGYEQALHTLGAFADNEDLVAFADNYVAHNLHDKPVDEDEELTSKLEALLSVHDLDSLLDGEEELYYDYDASKVRKHALYKQLKALEDKLQTKKNVTGALSGLRGW